MNEARTNAIKQDAAPTGNNGKPSHAARRGVFGRQGPEVRILSSRPFSTK
jgi:hypothetical protein